MLRIISVLSLSDWLYEEGEAGKGKMTEPAFPTKRRSDALRVESSYKRMWRSDSEYGDIPVEKGYRAGSIALETRSDLK